MVIGRRQSVFGDPASAAAEALAPIADLAAMRPPTMGDKIAAYLSAHWFAIAFNGAVLAYGFSERKTWAKWAGGLGLGGTLLVPLVESVRAAR